MKRKFNSNDSARARGKVALNIFDFARRFGSTSNCEPPGSVAPSYWQRFLRSC